MITETVPYVAGVLTGRGGFDETDGRLWLFIIALDHEVVTEAPELRGGRITAREYGAKTQWKWSVGGHDVLRVLTDVLSHLRGYKRDKAEEMIKRHKAAA
jgi:hypothetical protein